MTWIVNFWRNAQLTPPLYQGILIFNSPIERERIMVIDQLTIAIKMFYRKLKLVLVRSIIINHYLFLVLVVSWNCSIGYKSNAIIPFSEKRVLVPYEMVKFVF